MVLVEREGVGGVEAAEGGVVVELVACAGKGGFVAVGVEVSGVAGVVEHGTERGAARGVEADDGGFGSGAVESAVGSVVELGVGEADGREGAVVEVAAEVCGGDAVEENLVRVCAAAAHEERGSAAGLAGLDDLAAGRLAEVVDEGDLGCQCGLRDQSDDGA